VQAVDFTTALLLSRELAATVVPARIENAYQLDGQNLALGLRTLEGGAWLAISWHAGAARIHAGEPPPREKEQMSYTFSQQLRAVAKSLNVLAVRLAGSFERVVVLDLAPRITDAPTHRLYVEIMASRSNVILTQVDDPGSGTFNSGGISSSTGGSCQETVVACAYQVSPNKSVRPLSTGQPYALPPTQAARVPVRGEPLEVFRELVGRVPTQALKKAL
ncbi:unnamed protein product, partial [Phaeothamnion confervicola]